MKRKLSIALLLLVALPLCDAQEKASVPGRYEIRFDTPTSLRRLPVWGNRLQGVFPSVSQADTEWESQSLPLGNGSIGASVLGSIQAERITLNEKSLWRGGPGTSGGAAHYWRANKESSRLLPEIRQAYLDGNPEKAAELTRRNFNGLVAYDESDEKEFRFGSFTTAGELKVWTG